MASDTYITDKVLFNNNGFVKGHIQSVIADALTEPTSHTRVFCKDLVAKYFLNNAGGTCKQSHNVGATSVERAGKRARGPNWISGDRWLKASRVKELPDFDKLADIFERFFFGNQLFLFPVPIV